ncbi:unnamed protein product [Ranitomeya imitator]|uniref:Uncharacterized protein n=1 Tax=Ranitomeya imitator TaxID=111125 RepID=A0ABN9KR01_9NEOB|nr:unnamed protein product [Ranitomeya imitator]
MAGVKGQLKNCPESSIPPLESEETPKPQPVCGEPRCSAPQEHTKPVPHHHPHQPHQDKKCVKK